MTRIFARPTKAFFDYEQSLKRPVMWPPTKHDVPTLWERAKAMFGVICATIRSAASLACRFRFGRRERRELERRLMPVERLVRTLLMTEAATYLLMTPEGAKLRAETPIIEPPAPPPPVGVKKHTHSTTILMPGWQTIAAFHPRIDPRVVEREERERREALERQLTDLETLTAAPEGPDPLDPQNWRLPFRVLRWVHPEPDSDDPNARPIAPKRPRGGPSIMTFGDTNFPIVAGMTIVRAPKRACGDSLDDLHEGLAFARRIEALSRVLADPAPHIRRLARRLASLPADCIGEPTMPTAFMPCWHGNPENWNACNLAEPAFRALIRVATWRITPPDSGPPPEPG